MLTIEDAKSLITDDAACRAWTAAAGVRDGDRARANLLAIAGGGLPLDLFAIVAEQLVHELPRSSDPDRALNNLERFLAASRNPLSLATLFERDAAALPILLQIFAASQHLSDVLVGDSESYDLLRATEGRPAPREALMEELCAEIECLDDRRAVMEVLRRFKRRETLRIAYGDMIAEQDLATVVQQISFLADALIEAALRAAWKGLARKWGEPRTKRGEPARFVALALGKLGGCELNYSSDIDLMYLYDGDGATDGGKRCDNFEFFDRLGREIGLLLSEATDAGYVYRVDMRLRPQGAGSPLVIQRDAAFRYYESLGRTWERQAFVKARPVAGDLELGRQFLSDLEPWIYRRYLSLADISGIKALKRKMEQRTLAAGEEALDVKTGRGGIRDIEFAIQFLQLLNGGDLPELRTGNTLTAISRLETAGCLTSQEASLLGENYRFLRKVEHRLQIMFDLQTHRLPDEPLERARLAVRLGYDASDPEASRAGFDRDYRHATELDRKVLNHLLHDAFGEDHAEPEVDLVFDPEPTPEQIHAVLAPRGFRDVPAAYQHLMSLAKEDIRFLNTRRCRHFLASIAPRLLAEVAATPDPDSTLLNLARVSESLGGKSALWELFSFSPPTLQLYVRLCASSPFLCGILTSNPGMIDELLDGLLLGRLPDLPALRARLAELCRAAEDIDPILHSFKNANVLHVGVRDILDQGDLEASTAALSDIAQACLEQIGLRETARLAEKLGEPYVGEGDAQRRPGFAVVGVGKFGGRELNYHSDLDVLFLFEEEGRTRPPRGRRDAAGTSCQHFFSELGQRIIKSISKMGPNGRLYEMDARLRPSGRSGALAASLEALAHYFETGEGQLWERQALCKARVVYADPPEFAEVAQQAIAAEAYGKPWEAANVQQMLDMRRRLEESVGRGDMKRGPGGLVDVEFLTQMFQLRGGAQHPELQAPSTLAALAAAASAGLIEQQDAEALAADYRFLRRLEARLRLMNSTARTELPTDEVERNKLAMLLGFSSADAFEEKCRETTTEIRNRFDRLMHAAMQP